MKTKSLTTLLRLKIEEVQLAKNNLDPIKDNPTVVKDYHAVCGRLEALVATNSLVAHKSRIEFSLL